MTKQRNNLMLKPQMLKTLLS